MKTIKYTTGPDSVGFGVAGRFERKVPRTIPADLADRLLQKTSIKFTELPAEKPAAPKKEK